MIELNLPTMTCDHCARTVTDTVRRIDASATLDIDLDAQRVRIDSSLPRERFAAALADEGYPARPAPERSER